MKTLVLKETLKPPTEFASLATGHIWERSHDRESMDIEDTLELDSDWSDLDSSSETDDEFDSWMHM